MSRLLPQGLSNIDTAPGAVIGVPNKFHPHKGDTRRGGRGEPVNGIGCYKTMVLNKYHVHVYLGIVYEGTQMALPSTIGMVDPGPAVQGFTNTAKCFYRIHTHDSSGIVHFEFARNLPVGAEFVHMKDILDIWGVRRAADRFGPFAGPIHVFYGTAPLGQVTVSSYRPYTRGPLDDILLRSHEVVWIEIGKKYYSASQLPSVTFYMEY
jgi:hypothetical protein